jgi:FMN phosphatase YigB (HAD superfamily)
VSGTGGSRPARVIFVDFGGVISDDEYWLSLRQHGHPLKARLDAGMTRIWHESPEISRAWMRGDLGFAQVLTEMGLDGQDPVLLERVLQEDARLMRVHPGLAGLLPAWVRAGAELVLATDNTRPFKESFEAARTQGARGGGPLRTMADVAPWFSETLCSCDAGCLKSESAQSAGLFFGPALRARGLGFADALLVDDRAGNCEAFRRAGGTAVRWSLRDGTADLAGPVADCLAWHDRPMDLHAYPLPRESPHGFVGRDVELARLDAHLSADGHRAAWIPGPGGSGKTALAVHWARTRADRYPDGQAYIDLYEGSLDGAVVDAIRALTGQPPWDRALSAFLEQYQRLLAARRVLIVYDNVRAKDKAQAMKWLVPREGASAVIMTSLTGQDDDDERPPGRTP